VRSDAQARAGAGAGVGPGAGAGAGEEGEGGSEGAEGEREAGAGRSGVAAALLGLGLMPVLAQVMRSAVQQAARQRGVNGAGTAEPSSDEGCAEAGAGAGAEGAEAEPEAEVSEGALDAALRAMDLALAAAGGGNNSCFNVSPPVSLSTYLLNAVNLLKFAKQMP
jgi:hypothetical protein